MDVASIKRRFPAHGYAGIAIILVAEALLFGGNQLVGHWFTPIVWTGYILFADALVFKLKGRSLVMTDRLEFVIIVLVSIAGWWLFEFYNAPRFWKSDLELWWHYHNLEPNLFLRRVGYDWAFATIFPLLFLTAEVFTVTVFKQKGRGLAIKLSKPTLIVLVLLGAIGAIAPLLYPSAWLAPVIWLSFILLLDPLNAMRGWPSLTGDLARGDWRRLWSLLASGLVCGVLWEFWNHWALSKWTYTVPYFGNVKIFEMPVLGFLGFPPFAIECWAMYVFCRSLLGGKPDKSSDAIWIATNA
ncbi:MAG TPA: hypothetical protein VHE60_16180 [Pyrinomonadaceae bacterium]|nr:hypothetical protein [Pyrinomonadaceae bacterium]